MKREIALTIHMFIKSLMILIVQDGILIVKQIPQRLPVKQVALQRLVFLHLILQIVKIGILCALLKVIIPIVKKEVVQTLN